MLLDVKEAKKFLLIESNMRKYTGEIVLSIEIVRELLF